MNVKLNVLHVKLIDLRHMTVRFVQPSVLDTADPSGSPRRTQEKEEAANNVSANVICLYAAALERNESDAFDKLAHVMPPALAKAQR